MGALISTVLSLVRPARQPILRTCYGLPLPPRVHQVVDQAEVDSYQQIFVIGDVHGCSEELGKLLTAARADDGDTLKIFAGDMINKGPDSPGVLKMMRCMPHYAVRGNNEESVLRECRSRAGDATYCFPDKYRWIEGLAPGDAEYLGALPYSLELPSLNVVVVHAGLVPGRPLWAQKPVDMVTMRNLVVRDYYDDVGIVATGEIDVGSAWAPLWRGPQHVYFGHDAMRELQLYDFATGLDTGCVYGKSLTGVFITGKRRGETVSVPARMRYKKSKAAENGGSDDTGTTVTS